MPQLAQSMPQDTAFPPDSKPIATIDRHPDDIVGLGYVVLRFMSTGVEVTWDGQTTRTLPFDWRDRVRWEDIQIYKR